MGDHEQEFAGFALKISRELGSIDSKLQNIEIQIHKQNSQFDVLWKKVDGHTETLNNIKLKVVFAAGLISGLFNLPDIVNMIKKILLS